MVSGDNVGKFLRMFGLEPWHIWVITAIVLVTLEVFVQGFVLVSLAMGALVAAVAHNLTDDLGWGLAGFVVGSAVALAVIRPLLVRTLMDDKPSPFGTEGMKGDSVIISAEKSASGGYLTRYRDSLWNVESSDELRANDKGLIINVRGNTLIVTRIEKE